MRPNNFLLVISSIVAINALLAGCKGSGFIGENRKEKAPDPNAEPDAIQPAIVTGTYLACEQAEEIRDGRKTSYGCALRSDDDTMVPPPNGYVFDFFAKTPATPPGQFIAPQPVPPDSDYQALFIIPDSDPDPISFAALKRKIIEPKSRTYPLQSDYAASISRQSWGSPIIPAPSFRYNCSCLKIKNRFPNSILTMHWTHTNERDKALPDPTCNSEIFAEPPLGNYIHFKAVNCSVAGSQSAVVEKIHEPVRRSRK